MLVVAGLILGQVKFFQVKHFLVEVVANLSLHSKQLELGQDVLRYSNPDKIMMYLTIACPDLQRELGMRSSLDLPSSDTA